MSSAQQEFARLLETMAKLRSPEGCPWDREQSLDSLRQHAVEEVYEVVDAIDRRDWDGLAEELGDLQLQVVFQAEVASSDGLFDMQRVLEGINDKLVRRHPHVFADESIATADGVTTRWEQIKAAEKPRRQDSNGRLDGVPRSQPAMLEAGQIGKRAARCGFDWRDFGDLKAKLDEEFDEVLDAHESGDAGKLEEEVGDLLFMAVNVARAAKVNPEVALKGANRKFRERFTKMEHASIESGRQLEDCTLDEMEALWQRAKQY